MPRAADHSITVFASLLASQPACMLRTVAASPAIEAPATAPRTSPGQEPPGGLSRAALRSALPRLFAGVLVSLAILVSGSLVERAALGATDQELMTRIARDVERIIKARTGELHRMADRVVVSADQVRAASSDPEAARALFDASARAIDGEPPGRVAVTVFGPSDIPLAWSGRPSELPADRLEGGRALFVAPGLLGPRLVYVVPVPDRSGRRPAGTVAVERVLAGNTSSSRQGDDEVRVRTRYVPVLLRARYEGAGEAAADHRFLVTAPDGGPLLEGHVDPPALVALRTRYRDRTHDAALAVLALAIVVSAVPFLTWRERSRRVSGYVAASLIVAGLLVAARTVAIAAVPTTWWWPSAGQGGWLSLLLLRSPVDLLVTAALLLTLVWLFGGAVERRRIVARHAPVPSASLGRTLAFTATHLAAGAGLAAVLIAHRALVNRVFTRTSADPLQFSLHPFSAERLTFVLAVLFLGVVTLWAGVAILRAATTVWRVRRREIGWRLATAALWLAPLAVAASVGLGLPRAAIAPLWVPAVAAVLLAGLARLVVPKLRRGSQAMRMMVRFLIVALPGLVFYPTMTSLSAEATERIITQSLGPQALSHRNELQVQLRRSLAQIDAMPDLLAFVQNASTRPDEPPPTDAAFTVWQQTDLARLRLTSSIELYAGDGSLVSRFALNLPAEIAATPQWTESGCGWDIFGEPLAGTEDRVLLHAGRGLCPSDGARRGAPQGAIVVHVMLDYGTLPFLASQNPYGDLLQPGGEVRRDAHGRTIAFAMYGWGRTPIFPNAGTAWPISRELLNRIYRAGRTPIWEIVQRGDQRFRVYFLNDRAGIYALGYELPRPVDHFIALAELLTLAGVAYVALLLSIGLIRRLAGYRATHGRSLLREIRGSYYRKLFLAFVAAAVVPVIALALLTRTYIASQLRDGIESAAVQTAAVAKRVVETVVSQQRRDTNVRPVFSDEIMVWVSRVIGEDVNVFAGPRLMATSQRDLFASGDLPTRTPAEVYRAIVLERQASYVGEEHIGTFAYMVAAAPVREGDVRTILTVPLALRQQEIEREIDALDRRVLLASVCFILLGAGIGYYMAERIADPVSRLTRATRRIARGDLDARIVTATTDELRRLVDAFNSMAADLQRQRVELERTNRLAAWAEMARQVAHDIKNPLTPIQLSAEHLRRVHEDRKRPLGPVLDGCIDTILSQVRLLRQISSEFSSFASAPQARLQPTAVNEIVEEILEPYLTAPARVTMARELAPDLPAVPLDRTLVGRALINIVENALHAMPGGGTLTVRTRRTDGGIAIDVEDTGIGMDEDARARLFEPYFSTRATGTGLGLTIAKRNVELNHGRIAVESQAGRGTTVTLAFPIGEPPGA
jgi:signal transduction histidine kinase